MSRYQSLREDRITFLGREYEFMKGEGRPRPCAYCGETIRSGEARWREWHAKGHFGTKEWSTSRGWNIPYQHYHDECLEIERVEWTLRQ